ncbi:hypothetical protein EDB83DRAFT_2411833 [Lactarius deliciosus]|nr:hypothetical protein EDB83DRAFT_2411833 [Lactarius deliciosus]
MGEQSVGKSFTGTLNHLPVVDTPFAGSAMRTTGVWMSVSPTEDVHIVALDFEGVHSLERSAQEDWHFFVLFYTAISNSNKFAFRHQRPLSVFPV